MQPRQWAGQRVCLPCARGSAAGVLTKHAACMQVGAQAVVVQTRVNDRSPELYDLYIHVL